FPDPAEASHRTRYAGRALGSPRIQLFQIAAGGSPSKSRNKQTPKTVAPSRSHHLRGKDLIAGRWWSGTGVGWLRHRERWAPKSRTPDASRKSRGAYSPSIIDWVKCRLTTACCLGRDGRRSRVKSASRSTQF